MQTLQLIKSDSERTRRFRHPTATHWLRKRSVLWPMGACLGSSTGWLSRPIVQLSELYRLQARRLGGGGSVGSVDPPLVRTSSACHQNNLFITSIHVHV